MSDLSQTIACDESGAEGENIMGSRDPWFVHASTSISMAEADTLLAEFRAATRTQALEIKSRTALKSANRTALLALVEGVGDRGNIYLLEKSFFMSAKLVHTLIGEPTMLAGLNVVGDGIGRAMAGLLYEFAPSAIGVTRWQRLLQSFNDLIRLHARSGDTPPQPDIFFKALSDARAACRNEYVAEILEWMWQFREYVSNYGRLDSRTRFREFDPIFGTLASVSMTWRIRVGDVPLTFVVDRYSTLDAETIEMIKHSAADPLSMNAPMFPPGQINDILMVDSREDRRVQVADILAGCGQEIARIATRFTLDDPLQEATREMLDCNGMWAETSPINALWDRKAPTYFERWLEGQSN